MGRPRTSISGFGRSFGVNRLWQGLTEKKSMDEILRFMTEYMNERSDIEVALVGLRKDQDGVSLVKLIGCPATCLDTEHWCCIMMTFTERMAGGARGLRTRY